MTRKLIKQTEQTQEMGRWMRNNWAMHWRSQRGFHRLTLANFALRAAANDQRLAAAFDPQDYRKLVNLQKQIAKLTEKLRGELKAQYDTEVKSELLEALRQEEN